MSQRNGDRSRFNRERKAKIRKRAQTRAIRAKLAESAKPAAK